MSAFQPVLPADNISNAEPAAPFPAAADPARFRWLTGNAYVAAREARLLARIGHLPEPLLEIGAGEGANLHQLRSLGLGHRVVALDRAPAKLVFARSVASDLSVVAGDALALPFASQVFASVLLRDVLHHVPGRVDALNEAARVLRPGGRLAVLEANGAPLLARVFARLFAHERGLRESRLERLELEVRAVPGLALECAEAIEPFPIFRLLFHHRFGWPGLARSGLGRTLAESLEALGARAGSPGSYLLILARRPCGRGLSPQRSTREDSLC